MIVNTFYSHMKQTSRIKEVGSHVYWSVYSRLGLLAAFVALSALLPEAENECPVLSFIS